MGQHPPNHASRKSFHRRNSLTHQLLDFQRRGAFWGAHQRQSSLRARVRADATAHAHGRSHNDVPMLSLVGTAVAINPDSDMREVAKNRGWEIRDFRTARKAAKVGVPTALGLGAIGGGVAAIITRKRGA